MLQITLDSTAKQTIIPSANPNNWGFKLRVVNDGDSTELRVCFDDNSIEENMNIGYESLPEGDNIIGDSLS
jgi:hypothetical protein